MLLLVKIFLTESPVWFPELTFQNSPCCEIRNQSRMPCNIWKVEHKLPTWIKYFLVENFSYNIPWVFETLCLCLCIYLCLCHYQMIANIKFYSGRFPGHFIEIIKFYSLNPMPFKNITYIEPLKPSIFVFIFVRVFVFVFVCVIVITRWYLTSSPSRQS